MIASIALLVGEAQFTLRSLQPGDLGWVIQRHGELGLDSARRLYEAEGFRLLSETEEHAWGKPHHAQWWELEL